MIFLILVTCKKKATPASFLRQKIHSPARFSALFLSSLESILAKLGEHVTLWFALTPPSLKWLTEQKNPKSLLRSTLEFSIYTVVCCLSPINFLGHFRISPSLCFKARQTAKPLAWQWILILIQTKLIIARKVLYLALFRKWGLNSELAYSMVLPWWYLLTRKYIERPS